MRGTLHSCFGLVSSPNAHSTSSPFKSAELSNIFWPLQLAMLLMIRCPETDRRWPKTVFFCVLRMRLPMCSGYRSKKKSGYTRTPWMPLVCGMEVAVTVAVEVFVLTSSRTFPFQVVQSHHESVEQTGNASERWTLESKSGWTKGRQRERSGSGNPNFTDVAASLVNAVVSTADSRFCVSSWRSWMKFPRFSA